MFVKCFNGQIFKIEISTENLEKDLKQLNINITQYACKVQCYSYSWSVYQLVTHHAIKQAVITTRAPLMLIWKLCILTGAYLTRWVLAVNDCYVTMPTFQVDWSRWTYAVCMSHQTESWIFQDTFKYLSMTSNILKNWQLWMVLTQKICRQYFFFFLPNSTYVQSSMNMMKGIEML